MATQRFAITHHGAFAWLTVLFGGRSSALVTEGDHVVVTYGRWFRARFSRSVIAGVVRNDRKVLSRGVHGWGGRWLVNGAGTGLVTLTLEPTQGARTIGVPVRLRELTVNVDDPDALVAALSA